MSWQISSAVSPLRSNIWRCCWYLFTLLVKSSISFTASSARSFTGYAVHCIYCTYSRVVAPLPPPPCQKFIRFVGKMAEFTLSVITSSTFYAVEEKFCWKLLVLGPSWYRGPTTPLHTYTRWLSRRCRWGSNLLNSFISKSFSLFPGRGQSNLVRRGQSPIERKWRNEYMS